MDYAKITKTLKDILSHIKQKVELEEQKQKSELAIYSKLINRQLSTAKLNISNKQEKKVKEKEKVIEKIKIQDKVNKEMDSVILDVEAKIKQINEAVINQVKPKNFHYQASSVTKPTLPSIKSSKQTQSASKDNKAVIDKGDKQVKKLNYHYQQPLPPRAVKNTIAKQEKKQTIERKPTIKEVQRNLSAKKTQEILEEINAIKNKKQQVAAKITANLMSKEKHNSLQKKRQILVEQQQKISAKKEKNENYEIAESLTTEAKITTIQKLQSFVNPNFIPGKGVIVARSIKPFIEKYEKQQLGYRQQEQKGRISFLRYLNKFSADKQDVDEPVSLSIEKRGWKGCRYIDLMDNQLSQFQNKREQLEQIIYNKKLKITSLYEIWYKANKIRANYQRLIEHKSTIKAPPLLNPEIQFQVVKPSIQKRINTQTISLDSYLLPIYVALEPILQQMKQKEAMNLNDIRFFVEILNMVKSRYKRSYTLIEVKQLQNFKQLMEEQMY